MRHIPLSPITVGCLHQNPSDAGVLLLREVEKRMGLLGRLADCFSNHRDPRLIEHTVRELLGQHIYGLCLGYEDLNDHDRATDRSDAGRGGGERVPTTFEPKHTLRGVHLELGGVKSAEHTHESDRVGETQSIVAAPPQGDLASVGFEKGGHRESDGGERRRGRRPSGFCQEQRDVYDLTVQ